MIHDLLICLQKIIGRQKERIPHVSLFECSDESEGCEAKTRKGKDEKGEIEFARDEGKAHKFLLEGTTMTS